MNHCQELNTNSYQDDCGLPARVTAEVASRYFRRRVDVRRLMITVAEVERQRRGAAVFASAAYLAGFLGLQRASRLTRSPQTSAVV